MNQFPQNPPPQPGPEQPQQGYPSGPPQQGYPPARPPLRPMSARGPKVLTFVGGGVLILAVVAFVFAVIGLVSLAPTGIINAQGEPGSDGLLTIESSDPVALESPGDVSYALWQVTGNRDVKALRPSAAEVTGPNGEGVAILSPSVSSNFALNRVHTRNFAEFRASEPGTYLITIMPTTAADIDSLERVIVADASELGGFIGGIFSSAGLMIIGIGGGIVGFGMTVGGIVWWVMARNRNKRVAAQG